MENIARQEMLDTYAKYFKYLNIFMLWMWRLGKTDHDLHFEGLR